MAREVLWEPDNLDFIINHAVGKAAFGLERLRGENGHFMATQPPPKRFRETRGSVTIVYDELAGLIGKSVDADAGGITLEDGTPDIAAVA